jgi:hypothetical protein
LSKAQEKLMSEMYRPKNSRSPAHVVPWKARTEEQYHLYLSVVAANLLEREDNPDQQALKIGEILAENGLLLSPPETRDQLLQMLADDDHLLSQLHLQGATMPLVQASKEEAKAAERLTILEWAENLGASVLE